jgi:uncharacterized protein (TIGR02687 family)
METRQLNEALNKIFNEEGHRIVFWNDPEREFQSLLQTLEPGLALEGITQLRLDEIGSLEVKIRLEREDTTGRYLLYSPAEEADYEDDWLLDIRLYSRSFRADRASIILDELGLINQHLRQHLADRRKFFDSKERLQKLKSLVAKDDIAADLDRKMMAVVTKADQPELFNIIRTIFHAYTDQGNEIDLDDEPNIWEQMGKFDLTEPFWRMVRSAFGYEDEDSTLKKLLIRLFVTDFAHQLKTEIPIALQNLVLPAAGQANAVVCLAQWRDSSSKGSSYDQLSSLVASLVRLEDYLHKYEVADLVDVMSFEIVEKRIASNLREMVQSTVDTINADEVRAVASRRQAGHWASQNINGSQEVPRQAYRAVYSALVAAADFFALRNQYRNGFEYTEAAAMYAAYEKEIFRFDQLYRLFCENADQAESKGWGILKPLRNELEACYINWYLQKMALSWGRFIDPKGSTALLSRWKIENISNQQRFYDRLVKPRLDEAENRRAYVIISDAFRYEAAQELTQELNGKYRFEAVLSSQLGVLPSYTALGMASLLPHETLGYKSNGDVIVDGKPNASLEQRNEILKAVGGIVCKADDLMAMKKEDGREYVSGRRVVYIYHNVVDAIGDYASTEEKTFDGVRKAIIEIADLVAYVINSLNGNYVVITADHGFLFNESPPGEPEKSKLEQHPEGTIKAKKRYLIGANLPDHESVWHGKTKITAGADGEMEFWIPKGANRFHFTGGAKFIHGGAMLQEVVVPVITVRHVKGKSARDTLTKRVTVQVLGASHKITTYQHRFKLIQMEPVSERVKPITLKVAVYEENEPVTNIETVTFDNTSENMEERSRWVSLVLQDRQYDKKISYRLILRDAETGIEQQSVPVIIDRAFNDDF